MIKEELSFGEHLEELRTMLLQFFLIILAGIGGAFYFYREIFDLLLYPLKKMPEDLILFHPLEGFTSMLQVCLWTGILATSPFWLGRTILFVWPALHPKEKRVICLFLALFVPFLMAGLGFCFLIVIPLMNQYLYAFNDTLGKNLWSLSTYLDYTLMLCGSFTIIFEACAVLFLLVHLGVLTEKMLRKKRGHLIVGAFVIGAFLTPPDVISQCLVALPLIGLYEVAILYGIILRGRELNLSCHDHRNSSAIAGQAN